MAASKSISDADNAALRARLEAVVKERFGDKRKTAAAALGFTTTALNDALGGRRKVGARMILRLIEIDPQGVAEAMNWPLEPRRAQQDLPNLSRALRMAKADGMLPVTLTYGRSLATLWRVDKQPGEWVTMLEQYDQAHREQATPQSSAVRPKRRPKATAS